MSASHDTGDEFADVRLLAPRPPRASHLEVVAPSTIVRPPSTAGTNLSTIFISVAAILALVVTFIVSISAIRRAEESTAQVRSEHQAALTALEADKHYLSEQLQSANDALRVAQNQLATAQREAAQAQAAQLEANSASQEKLAESNRRIRQMEDEHSVELAKIHRLEEDRAASSESRHSLTPTNRSTAFEDNEVGTENLTADVRTRWVVIITNRTSAIVHFTLAGDYDRGVYTIYPGQSFSYSGAGSNVEAAFKSRASNQHVAVQPLIIANARPTSRDYARSPQYAFWPSTNGDFSLYKLVTQ